MKIFVYEYVEARDVPAVSQCATEIERLGCEIASKPDEADLAIAPLLQRKISDAESAKPKRGTLIFHPSLLPRHRGRDAIRRAYRNGEKFTGATWFWADAGLDTGDICEQEVVAIPDKRPRDFYEQDVLPVCVKLLRYAIADLQAGVVRRRPQSEAATWEKGIG